MYFNYKYKMDIKVGDTQLPDPSKWTYQVGDLDTSGSRDATGLLEWEMLQRIVKAVQKPKFKLTAPDPRTFDTPYTGNYYVGDRTGSCNYYLPERPDVAVFNLKLKFIEY